MESSEPPISGKPLSIFCNVTVLDNDNPGASLTFKWLKDGVTLTDEYRYIGLGSDQINLTVSTIA